MLAANEAPAGVQVKGIRYTKSATVVDWFDELQRVCDVPCRTSHKEIQKDAAQQHQRLNLFKMARSWSALS